MKKLLISTLLGAMLLGAGATTTVLAVNVGGGEWNYGVGWSGTFGYSDYYHGSRNHTSSVGRSAEDMNRAYGAAGNWSNATYMKIPPTGLTYWWNYA